MHPELVHKSTTKAPDSGLRLGFSDIGKENAGATPSKSRQISKLPEPMSSPDFKFQFVSDKDLSQDAQKLRAEIRDKASQIKEEMRAQQKSQDEMEKDLFNATGRKIAKPKGKASRFSDVHIAEFKKMDSIENHPSSFRAQPKFAQPTANSLKRTNSKACLDEPDRPRTAGKDSISGQDPSISFHGPTHSPAKNRFGFHSVTNSSQLTSPAKRPRQADDNDVSAGRPVSRDSEAGSIRSSNLPRPKSSSSLFTPTNASLGRFTSTKPLAASASKSSLSSRPAGSGPVMSEDDKHQVNHHPPYAALSSKISLLPKSPSMQQLKEATTMSAQSPSKALPPAPVATPLKAGKPMKSMLPTFSGLKSILRRTGSRPISNDPVKIAAGTHVASPAGNETIGHRLNDLSSDGVQNAHGRRSTLFKRADTPKKRVEFTPSVKNRFDLAAASPSPAKGLIPKDAPIDRQAGDGLFDSAAYVIDPNATESDSDGWESADDDNSKDAQVDYPALSKTTSSPKTPDTDLSRRQTGFQQHLQQDSSKPKSRNDPGFKSIFTTLRKPSSKASPSTIRRVREQEAFPIAGPGSSTAVAASSPGQTSAKHPYPSLPTIPHGLPSKKRRRSSSLSEGDKLGFQDIVPPAKDVPSTEANKENRRFTASNLAVPGGFPRDSGDASFSGFLEPTVSSRARSEQPTDTDHDEKRATKRTKLIEPRVAIPVSKNHATVNATPKAKASKARKEAAASARLRKMKTKTKTTTPSRERTCKIADADSNSNSERGRGSVGQGRGVLSLSRLNLLARPKERK